MPEKSPGSAQVRLGPAEYDGCPFLHITLKEHIAMRRWIRFAPAAATIAVVVETMGAGHKW
jgi:hypothetical protein